MKFIKSPFIFLSLFLCSLLSAQEAQFEVNLKPEKSDLKYKVEKFAEDYIDPMMRGDVYDIEINNVELMTDYQNNNPIYCQHQDEVRGVDLWCHDKSSYSIFHEDKNFEDVPGSQIHPFSVALNRNDLNPETSVIISFQIRLKQDFENSLIQFLEEEADAKDELSYSHYQKEYWLDPSSKEYLDCMRSYVPRCKGKLAETNMPLSTNRTNTPREPNYVINFIDRRSKKVTFYNLKNYRWELFNNNRYRVFTYLCNYMRSGYLNFDDHLRHLTEERLKGFSIYDYPQFADLLIAFKDKNQQPIHETAIKTHQGTDIFQTSTNTYFGGTMKGGQHTFGIEGDNFIFSFDYGSNVLSGRNWDYLGNRNIAGHLIDSNKDLFSENKSCRMPGLSAEYPAFSIVSNYEYHLILDLDQIDLNEVDSVEIKYATLAQ